MKKKLLSLVLAGAMVASTSVSAFAAETTISSYEEGSNKANVTISGSVDSDAGKPAAGTISVSIPTALQFQVDKTGDVKGTSIDVVNNGLDEVQIVADQFIDDAPNGSIKVNKPTEFTKTTDRNTKKRSEVVLWIQGNRERAYFNTVDDNGICNEQGITASDIVVSTLSKRDGGSNSDKIKLNGYAGTADIEGDNALTDQFTLRLKVKKVTQ